MGLPAMINHHQKEEEPLVTAEVHLINRIGQISYIRVFLVILIGGTVLIREIIVQEINHQQTLKNLELPYMVTSPLLRVTCIRSLSSHLPRNRNVTESKCFKDQTQYGKEISSSTTITTKSVL